MSTPTILTTQVTGRAATSLAAGPLSVVTKAQAANVTADVWASSGKEMLLVKNGSGSPITVTLKFGGTAANQVDGQTPANQTASVAAGDVAIFGPFLPSYKDGTGNVSVTYSAVTSVSVLVFIPATN